MKTSIAERKYHGIWVAMYIIYQYLIWKMISFFIQELQIHLENLLWNVTEKNIFRNVYIIYIYGII
jgi:hypothetical protein